MEWFFKFFQDPLNCREREEAEHNRKEAERQRKKEAGVFTAHRWVEIPSLSGDMYESDSSYGANVPGGCLVLLYHFESSSLTFVPGVHVSEDGVLEALQPSEPGPQGDSDPDSTN